MKNVMKNIIVIIGISIFGVGIVNAAPSTDCGDDDVQPIKIHSAVVATTNKDS